MKKTIMYLCLASLALFSCSIKEDKPSNEELIGRIENNLMPKIIIEGIESGEFNLLDRMEHHNVPGLSMAFLDDGKIQWTRTYGYADVENKIKVDENTLFQAASISKPVAAMAALALVEQDKLSLDDDVNQYLVGWQVEENEFTTEDKVTLRRLLSHSAGLTVHGFRGYSKADTIPGIIDILDGAGTANSDRIIPDVKPGTHYRYSGGGYTVMQKMLCDISGKEFPELMDKLVLSKIGMTSSTFRQPLPEEMESTAATAYRRDGSPVEGNWHSYPEMAAAGLWTTPTDLLKYAIEVYQSYQGKSNLVLSKEMTHTMLTPQIESHGLGPALGGEGDNIVFSHGGGNEGFRCQLFVFTLKGQGVAIMTNSDNGGSLYTEILRSFSKVFDWPERFKPITKTVLDLSREELEEYAGSYLLKWEEHDLIFELSANDAYLEGIQVWDEFAFKLYPEEKDSFFGMHDGVPFEFIRNAKGAISSVKITEGSRVYDCTKLSD